MSIMEGFEVFDWDFLKIRVVIFRLRCFLRDRDIIFTF